MLLASLLLIAAQTQAAPPQRPDPEELGPQAGQRLPAFEARDQSGRSRNFASLSGPKGLVLVFFRSADWCPYCKAQLVEMESQVKRFRKRGLEVAALSYDSVEVLKDFSTRKGITFPLLSDPDSKVIRAFGLLNEFDYPKGHMAHGVPFPGTFVTDASGMIVSRHFDREYQERRTAAGLLVSLGEPGAGPVKEIVTDQFVLRASVSNTEVAPGRRVTLVLDFTMRPKMHAYAPGVKGYRPLNFRLAENPFVTPHEVRYPESRPYTFAPLKETVPVFAGHFRVLQDVTALGPNRGPGGTPSPVIQMTEIDLNGTLEYQVCSDVVCHAPASMPLQWTLTVAPLDRERAPEALRKNPQR